MPRVHPFDAVALLILALIPVCISLFALSHLSLRLDEAQSLWQTSRTPEGIISVIARDVHVPLYHLLLHQWRETVGDGVGSARALSLLWYVLSIPALYALGSLTYSRSVGLFASLLFAISPIMHWYGNEIRMYTLFVFLTIINQYFYIRLFKFNDAFSWILYGLSAVLGTFAHYFFLLNLLSQAVFYALNRRFFAPRSLAKLSLVALIVASAIVPWAFHIYSIGDVAFQEPNLQAPSTVDFFNVFSEFIIGFQPEWLNTAVVSLWPIVLLTLGFFSLRKQSWLTPGGAYLIFAVFVSIPIAFLFSITVRPLFLSRYLLFTLPALYVLLAAIISVYPPKIAQLSRIGLITVMAAALAFMIIGDQNPLREEYRAVSNHLEKSAQADDIILVSPPFTIYPLEYYYRGSAVLQTLPAWDRYVRGPIPAFDPQTLPEEVASLTDSYRTVWIVLSYDQGYEDALYQYFEANFERLEVREFSRGLRVARYKLRYDPHNPPLSSLSH